MPQKCTYANNTQTTCNIGLLTKKDKQHSRSAFPLKANRMRWGRLQDMVVTTKGLAWHMRRGSWSIRLVHYKKKRNHKVGAPSRQYPQSGNKEKLRWTWAEQKQSIQRHRKSTGSREVKKSFKKDKRDYIDSRAEAAAGQDNLKYLYLVTR